MQETLKARSAGRLAISNLRKHYHSQQAVAGISLDIEPGEFVALLGPSGCGKTTLLGCIAGLTDPSAGDIRIDGQSILGMPIHRRDLGMVFQSYALFPHMSVRENVKFGLKMKGMDRANQGAVVDEALEMVRMLPFADRMPSQLSGGQQQRIALARAIVTRPRLLLLDEPFSALDAKLRESMQIEVRQLQKRLSITTIFVTHDQTEAMATADRIAVLNAGKLEQFDTPRTIYKQPASLFVADFIGTMNRLSGRLDERAGEAATIRLDSGLGTVMALDNSSIRQGSMVAAVVRPESITLRRSGTDGDAGMPPRRLAGTVSEVIFLGEKVTVLVQTPGGMFTTRMSGERVQSSGFLEPGTPVDVCWAQDDLLIYPEGATA